MNHDSTTSGPFPDWLTFVQGAQLCRSGSYEWLVPVSVIRTSSDSCVASGSVDMYATVPNSPGIEFSTAEAGGSRLSRG